jgi:FkbM family methyltransferase
MTAIATTPTTTKKRNRRDYKLSFSQSGEDVIAAFIFEPLGIKRPTYLDIGAHHPTCLSNTYHFYRKGSSGVCVEPNPALAPAFHQKRPRDKCLTVGVSTSNELRAPFYIMTADTLSTFSKEDAKRLAATTTQRIEQVIELPLFSINQIITDHFPTPPNFVSIDVEGTNFQVIQSLDFRRFRPEVLCIETLTYNEDKTERKLTEIIELMHSHGYMTYADTYVNTIFVDQLAWKNRLF